jgi:GT2 family glycosyltransferase
MGLLDSENGKRRLITVEIPIIEQYNRDRDADFRIQVRRHGGGLVLAYKLKPVHNIYQIETRLPSSYPLIPPETRVITQLRHCPHLLEGQLLCLWRQGSMRETSRWDPSKYTSVFAVQATWRWLACYEVWVSCGEWPLPEAK